MARRDEIISYCNALLRADTYRDYGPNGLQVAGRLEINRLAAAVSTSERTLREAVEWNADALLVHHGLLWGSQLEPLTGILAERLRIIFKHDLNLIAYHLPLDGHETLGNNARLCAALGFRISSRFAEVGGQHIGVIGERNPGLSLADLLENVSVLTEQTPLVVGQHHDDLLIDRLAIVSGSGYATIGEAAQAGCQALLTGDIREPTMAEARELGIAVIAAGHEATERAGVQALAGELQSHFDVKTLMISDPNPV